MTELGAAQSMLVTCGEALVDLVPAAVPGGGPMNVAIAAARLGVPAAFIGRVSTDAHGESIWNHLRKNGVELAAEERGDEPTARAIVELTPATSPRFEGEGTADTQLSEARLDSFDRPAGVVHGGTLGMFRGKTAERRSLGSSSASSRSTRTCGQCSSTIVQVGISFTSARAEKLQAMGFGDLYYTPPLTLMVCPV